MFADAKAGGLVWLVPGVNREPCVFWGSSLLLLMLLLIATLR
jgi:hypothetical protein